jgi:sugar phosphate isomerase/epimerase
MSLTRREFGKLAVAGIPAAGLWFGSERHLQAVQAVRPNSRWAGVQVGMNAPYNFGTGNVVSAAELLKLVVEAGVSGLELRAQPVELFMGSPTLVAQAAARGSGGGGRGGGRGGARAGAETAGAAAPATGRGTATETGQAAAGRAGGGRGQGGRRGTPQTPEQIAAQRAATEAVRKWRLSAPASKIREFRKMYEDAGVKIEVVKVDGLFNLADDELDYFFQMARDLGARALSSEISTPVAHTKRVGQFADKHRMMVGYHGHATTGPLEWEEAISYARYNGANLDIGHFVAGHNVSPVPFLKAHHDRIPHIHVKDRTFGTSGGQNVPFGEGDTPIREVLQLIRDNRWNIQATIEFEYTVPAGSDRMTELKRCVEYCRQALLA